MAQQEPTPPPTLEALVETLDGWGRVSQNEQGEVVEVYLRGPEVTDASLAHLTGLAALESLHLAVTQVTDAGLAHLTGLTTLEDLDLDRTQITDAGLAHLTGLPALRYLSVAGTQVTDAGVAELRKRLPHGVHSGRDPIPPPPPPPQ